jgi:CheY-like chemotaxis protein
MTKRQFDGAAERLWNDRVDCEEASDGLAAIRAVQHSPYDLLVLDVDMPQLPGPDVVDISVALMAKRADRLVSIQTVDRSQFWTAKLRIGAKTRWNEPSQTEGMLEARIDRALVPEPDSTNCKILGNPRLSRVSRSSILYILSRQSHRFHTSWCKLVQVAARPVHWLTHPSEGASDTNQYERCRQLFRVHFGQQFHQGLVLNRLNQVKIDSAFFRFLPVFVLSPSSQCHERHAPSPRFCSYPTRHVVTA